MEMEAFPVTSAFTCQHIDYKIFLSVVYQLWLRKSLKLEESQVYSLNEYTCDVNCIKITLRRLCALVFSFLFLQDYNKERKVLFPQARPSIIYTRVRIILI